MSARLAFYLTPAAERTALLDFLKTHFVLVDVDGYAPGGSRADVQWWTRVSGKAETDGCGNNAWYVATAGGTRLLDPVSRGLPDVRKALAEYRTRPEEDRKPKLAAPLLDSPKTARLAPPPGALVLRVYLSFLDGQASGDPTPVKRTRWFSEILPSRMPGTDVLWVTEKEWKALIPTAPRQGDKVAIPESLQNRITRYYAAQEFVGWNNTDLYTVRAADFALTVDAASGSGFRLRLEGFARKGRPFSEKDVDVLGADLRFLGYLHYDAAKQAFVRFDVVALGRGWGGGGEPINGAGKGPHVAYVPVYEQELRPYHVGMAWELVSGERAADRIPPGPGANGYPGWDPRKYFGKP